MSDSKTQRFYQNSLTASFNYKKKKKKTIKALKNDQYTKELF